jgi:hypothetical protein
LIGCYKSVIKFEFEMTVGGRAANGFYGKVWLPVKLCNLR